MAAGSAIHDNGRCRADPVQSSPRDVQSFAAARGAFPQLTPNQYRVWATRLEYEEGRRTLPEIRASLIPVGRTPDERTLIAGLVLLHRCRVIWEKDAAVPASRRFMAAWCGLPDWRVRRAWKALVHRGLAIQTGEYLKRGQRVRRSDGTVYTTEHRGALWKLATFIKHPPQVGNSLRSLTTVCARERYEGRESFLTLEEVLSRLKRYEAEARSTRPAAPHTTIDTPVCQSQRATGSRCSFTATPAVPSSRSDVRSGWASSRGLGANCARRAMAPPRSGSAQATADAWGTFQVANASRL